MQPPQPLAPGIRAVKHSVFRFSWMWDCSATASFKTRTLGFWDLVITSMWLHAVASSCQFGSTSCSGATFSKRTYHCRTMGQKQKSHRLKEPTSRRPKKARHFKPTRRSGMVPAVDWFPNLRVTLACSRESCQTCLLVKAFPGQNTLDLQLVARAP